MTEAERYKQAEKLFFAALELEPGQRVAFLAAACGADPALRVEVEALLASNEQPASFIDAPAFEDAAELLVEAGGESRVGQMISHYRILGLLGRGGVGEVYLAQDIRLERKVALKLLPEEFTADKGRVRRFAQEARAASALNHPNIITIHDIGQVGETHFIATEFVEGQTLRQQITSARLELGAALEIAAQVASALQAAHAAGITHRDIKPENIMVRPDGLVKVLDFGLAKLTERRAATFDADAPTLASSQTAPGTVMGTINYMSPEQARGLAVDGRTDIFSLGIVLYELIAGCSPFEGATASDVLAAILTTEPPLLAHYLTEVPQELERIVSKALRKDCEERYQVVKDMLIDLKDLKQDRELAARLERSNRTGERRKGESESGDSEKNPERSAFAFRLDPSATQSVAPTISSAKLLLGEIKRHKRGTLIILAALVVAATALFFYFHRQPVLTDKDTILLADFVNTTGDAVFDGTLKQALAVYLGQSPFLNIFSDARVRETLRYMGRPPDERVTREIAHEICQRRGLKALLAGSVSNLGRHYVMTLEAIEAQTGDVISRQQVEAENKEQVLRVLGQAATKLREEIGESLSSIQKYDAPLQQATTSSLEALKAWSLAREQNDKGNYQEAVKYAKRAVELDPNFASAYTSLAVNYNNLGQSELAAQFAQKAFELRERTSELEKFAISHQYYLIATGEVEKAIEVLELAKQTYPRSYTAHNNLGSRYRSIGQNEKAIAEYREAIRLNPNTANPYLGLGTSLRQLNRIAEAKEIDEQVVQQKLDNIFFHADLYAIALINGDEAGMQRQLDWASARPGEYAHLIWQAETAAFAGQWRQAREFSSRAFLLAQGRNLKENAATIATAQALTDALLGKCQPAQEDAAKGLAASHAGSSLWNGAAALALCGELGQAQSLGEEYAGRFPKDTLVQAIWLPAIRAAIETRRHNPAQAIQGLQAASRYGSGGNSWPEYFRGQAYLAQRSGREAAAEFQKMLDHRGLTPTGALWPLAHLGLARAAALTGETATSRKAYQDLLALWKDADPDLPVLVEAKKEYGQVK